MAPQLLLISSIIVVVALGGIIHIITLASSFLNVFSRFVHSEEGRGERESIVLRRNLPICQLNYI